MGLFFDFRKLCTYSTSFSCSSCPSWSLPSSRFPTGGPAGPETTLRPPKRRTTMTVIPPWTIKGVPEEDREKVRAAAKRMDLPIGRWLVQASDFAIAHERDPKEAPGEVMEAPTEAPARVGPLEDLERLTGILERLQGVPKSEGVVAVGRRVLRQRLEALLVPTLAPRLRVGHGSGSTGDESM